MYNLRIHLQASVTICIIFLIPLNKAHHAMQFSDTNCAEITGDDVKTAQQVPGADRREQSGCKGTSRTKKTVTELLQFNEMAQKKIKKILEINEPNNRLRHVVHAADRFASNILSQMDSEIKTLQKEIDDLNRKLRKYDQVDANSEGPVDNVLFGLCPSTTEHFKSRKRSLQTSPEASQSLKLKQFSSTKTPRFSLDGDSDTGT